jgi:hypothetical protein
VLPPICRVVVIKGFNSLIMIKRIIGIVLCMSCLLAVSAQKDCGTPAPAIKPVITAEKLNRIAMQRVQFTAPYPLKVFIRVFADNDGSNLAAPQADVLRQFENMRMFYSSFNVCFILVGYEVTRNTDLNDMNKEEDNDRNQIEGMALNNSMNIFIHNNLVDNDGGLNGTAYDIPNHFLSLAGSVVASTTNLTTMAHEMGHCLGLLHTFEPLYGMEAVARSGSCKDCEDEGDLLCDTRADLNTDNVNSSCVYTGTATDECGVMYLGEPTNIMTYGRRSCRDHFTSGQGARFLTYVLDDHVNRIAENTIVQGNANLVAGLYVFAARNSISFSASNFTVGLAATATFSSRAVTFSPGVNLTPFAGYVEARAGTFCQ